ncbi:hypothetical protein JFU13_24615 [Peribacillus sp. TH24]|nr:hypothetical protein [Peribacillus sp. TH24]
MFICSKISGKTKEENKEFDNEEITGEFMERYVQGAEKSVLFGADKKVKQTTVILYSKRYLASLIQEKVRRAKCS